jgi:hypothetical protein
VAIATPKKFLADKLTKITNKYITVGKKTASFVV